MEKAMILAELEALKKQGVEVGSYMEIMPPKVLKEILDSAREKASKIATEPAKTETQTPAPDAKAKKAKAEAARKKVAEKAVEDKKKAAEAKKKKSSGVLTLRSVRDWPALRGFLAQEDKVLLDASPTNILDKYLWNSGRGMKVSNAHKKFLEIIEVHNKSLAEDKKFNALKNMSSVRQHIRYREENDGWVFNREGEDADPKIKLVGLNPEFRGVKVADRPAEKAATK
jgi:hypothetical protein